MTTGILLMSFGSAGNASGVREYLRSVRQGEPSEESVKEFERRYGLVGHSPLTDITNAQAAALQEHLGTEYRVGAGMLHSKPFIEDSVGKLAGECDQILGVIMSPQYSAQIMAGYPARFGAALSAHERPGHIADAWYDLPSFHRLLAELVEEALQTRPPGTPVVFTAHSLPERVVERDPAYIEALKDTASAVAAECGLADDRWHFAYQSAGHTPEEWLRPDFKELLPDFKSQGFESVLVVPTQFLADHLEVLYDIDIAGSEEARSLGMDMLRIPMPNVRPSLVRCLAEVTRRNVHNKAA